MEYRLGSFHLDGGRFELRDGAAPVAVEPQVLAVLLFLVENRDRLVTKDELIERVWNGRIVSDAAIASRIKSARQAIGDDGSAQRLIRTVHGRGFRYVGEVEAVAASLPAAAAAAAPEPAIEAVPDKPSIAVLPFRGVEPGTGGVIADALPHDLITQLSRLRWLHVIARGSSFRLGDTAADVGQVGARLGARYCLTGSVELSGTALSVAVELADTRDRGVVWAEHYAARLDDVHDVRSRIVSSVIAALELHIPANEARLARLTAPENLGAWSAYHLALQHMFRFTPADNRAAGELFRQAAAKEPGFARAQAGLSFTHFQNAFLPYAAEREAEAAMARRHAEAAVTLDPLDPFANFAMGRSLWLGGDLEASLGWLGRATSLSPSYAQGVYATAWAETVLGRGDAGQAQVDRALALSPIDPLHYAMLATRGLAHLMRGETEAAARWADRAAREPGAHVLIAVIAALCHTLHGDERKAATWVADVRRRHPTLKQADFFRSFPFADAKFAADASQALARMGI